MSFTPLDFVATALSYQGSPWQHQGREKGVAIDCIGLILCAVTELGWDVSYVPKTYGRVARSDKLLKALADSHHTASVPIDEAQFGDIVVLTIGGAPRHFGILLSNNEMLHSYYMQSVLITDFEPWRGSLHSVWRLNYELDK